MNLGRSGEAFLERPHFSSNSCNSLGCLDVVVNVKAKESKKEEMDVQGKLETTTSTLHDNVYNIAKQSRVNKLNMRMEDIETRKARVAIESRVEWKKVGDRWSKVNLFNNLKLEL